MKLYTQALNFAELLLFGRYFDIMITFDQITSQNMEIHAALTATGDEET